MHKKLKIFEKSLNSFTTILYKKKFLPARFCFINIIKSTNRDLINKRTFLIQNILALVKFMRPIFIYPNK